LLKKKSHIALSLFLCCISATGAAAQTTVSFAPTETDITTPTNLARLGYANGRAALISLFSTIKVSANNQTKFNSTLGSTATLPLSIINLQVDRIDGVSLLDAKPVIVLPSAPTNVYYTTIGLLNGDLFMNYWLMIPGTAWIAGTYNTDLLYSANVTNTPPNKIQVTVPAFITPNLQPAIATLNVTTFNPYRGSELINATSTFDYFSSVETLLSIKAGSEFSFVPAQAHPVLPTLTNNSTVRAILSDGAIAKAVNLSTADQTYTLSSLTIPVNNKLSFTSNFSINAANLKSTFAQAGTYTLPITYSIAKTGILYAGAVATKTMSSSVKLVVNKMSEISAVINPVTFAFNTAAKYKTGLTAAVTTPVTLSSTVPYSLSVKADGDFILGGNSIPASVLTIEGAGSQTGITPVVLSTTPQDLVLSATPEIDRLINLQYRIPSTQTYRLVGKPAGTYTANITYTLVAP
jgi:hypothetical protein